MAPVTADEASTGSQDGVPRKRRPAVRRRDAPLYVEDETDDFKAALQSGDLGTAQDMLGTAPLEGAKSWLFGPLDDDDSTALHLALGAPADAQFSLVRFLIAQRVDANAQTCAGLTPLHLAAHRGSVYTVRALLCAGAENQRRTRDGRSTVDFAACNPSSIDLFEVLGWPGEGPRAKPLEPRTPGQAAAGGVVSAPGNVAAAAGADAVGADGGETEGLIKYLLLVLLWFALVAVAVAALVRFV